MVTKSQGKAELLTAGQAARLIGVSQVTVLKMAKDGRLRTAMKAGGFRFYDRADVEAVAARRAGVK